MNARSKAPRRSFCVGILKVEQRTVLLNKCDFVIIYERGERERERCRELNGVESANGEKKGSSN